MIDGTDDIVLARPEVVVRSRVDDVSEPDESLHRAPFDAAALFDASPVPAWIVDIKTHALLAVNGAACDHFGYAAHEMRKLSLADLCVPDDYGALAAQIASGPTGLDVANALRYRKRSGTIIYVIGSRHPTEFQGCPAVISILHDITERRRQERALEENEALLRAILENSPSVISIRGADGRYQMVNRAFERLCGLPAAEVYGKTHADVFDSGLAAEVARNHRTVVDSGRPMQFEETGILDGHPVTFITSRFPLHDQNDRTYAVCAISTDITERKKEEISQRFLVEASEALAGSLDYEETLHRVARLAVPRIADWCAVDMVLDDGSLRLLALEHKDPTKRDMGYELRRDYPPDPDERLGLVNVVRTGKSEIYPEITDEFLVASAKDARHLEIARSMGLRSVMVVPIVARDRVLGAITFVTTNDSRYEYTLSDLAQAEAVAARAALAIENARLYGAAQNEVAERGRMQDALTKSEERFRLALANTDIAVYTQDRDLRYVWTYHGAANAELSEIYGKTDAEILDPQHAALLTEIKKRVLETGVEEQHVVGVTRVGQELRYYDTSFAPLRDSAGGIVGVTGTVNDVTARKLAQDRLLRHQAEIEALNVRLQRAMSETHHRVKNNLQVVAALLEMEEMRHDSTVPISEIGRLRQHITALSTIHDMLTLQAKTDADVYDLSVGDAMDRLIPLLQGLAPGREIITEIEDMRLPVRHSTTLTILVNELVSNAVKHGKGKIELRLAARDGVAVLEICDRGAGFADTFDPAGTATTGIELVQALVQMDLQGETRFENRPDGGARVSVRFPVPEGERPGAATVRS